MKGAELRILSCGFGELMEKVEVVAGTAAAAAEGKHY